MSDLYGIYLHIPYCRAKCRYCDFYSAPGARGVPQAYVSALLRELAKNDRRPDTLYFGGGTPALQHFSRVPILTRRQIPITNMMMGIMHMGPKPQIQFKASITTCIL